MRAGLEIINDYFKDCANYTDLGNELLQFLTDYSLVKEDWCYIITWLVMSLIKTYEFFDYFSSLDFIKIFLTPIILLCREPIETIFRN